MKKLSSAKFVYSQLTFILILGFILLVGIYFRFVNFPERWTLSQDQARDAIIADFAIATKNLPLIGPHSSAGEFSFGPLYYWLIIFFKLFSNSIIISWVGFTFLSCLTVGIFGIIGYKLSGKIGGIIYSLVASLSCAQILHSTDMLNPIPIAFFVSLTLLSLVYFLQSQKSRFIFLMGLLIGIAINFHFESFLLLPLFLVVPLFLKQTRQFKLKSFLISLGGLIIGLSPLIFFDFSHDHRLFKNFFFYTFSGQENASAAISWLKDIVSFWPQFFGQIIFNQPYLGYPIVVCLLIACTLIFLKQLNYPLTIKIILVTFLSQIFLLHFYNGVRSPVYMIIFHPFIILLTSFTILVYYHLNKYLGVLFLTIFILLTFFQNFKIIEQKNQLAELTKLQKEISIKSPGKISLYERPDSAIVSLPLFYLYQYDNKLDSKGYKIGVCENKDIKDELGQITASNCPKEPSPFGGDGHFQLFDLSGFSDQQLAEQGFELITAKKQFDNLYKNY